MIGNNYYDQIQWGERTDLDIKATAYQICGEFYKRNSDEGLIPRRDSVLITLSGSQVLGKQRSLKSNDTKVMAKST